jgi:hypothetical protein
MRLFGDRDISDNLLIIPSSTKPSQSIIIPRQHIAQYFEFHHFDTPRLSSSAKLSFHWL